MLSIVLFSVACGLLVAGVVMLFIPIDKKYYWGASLSAIVIGWGVMCFALPPMIAHEANDAPEWMQKTRPFLVGILPWLYLLVIGVLLHIGSNIAAGTTYNIALGGSTTTTPAAQTEWSWFLFVAAVGIYVLCGIMLLVGIWQMINPTSEIDAALGKLAVKAQKADSLGKPRFFARRGKAFEITVPGEEMYESRKQIWISDVNTRLGQLEEKEDADDVLSVFHDVPKGSLVMRASVIFTRKDSDKKFSIQLEKEMSEEAILKWTAEQERGITAFMSGKSSKSVAPGTFLSNPDAGTFSAPAGIKEVQVVGEKKKK